jgi:transposase
VIKLVQRWRREGSVAPERYGGWKRPTLAAHAERVHALLRAEPDLTIAELRSRLADEAIDTSPAAISRFLTAEGLTRKKRPSTRPSRSGRTSPPRGPSGATDNSSSRSSSESLTSAQISKGHQSNLGGPVL